MKWLATLGLVCAAALLLPASAAASSVENGYGTFKVGNWPGADWRPYADGTPFNATVPDSPNVHPNFQNIVDKVMSYGDGKADHLLVPDQEVNEKTDPLGGDFTHPTYYSESDDPWKKVTCTEYGGECEISGEWVQIPEEAEPAHAEFDPDPTKNKFGDRHMAIVDQRQGIEYDFWQVRKITADKITASYGGMTEIKGDGLDSGATAGHFGNLAGVIRAQELAAGKIDHALFMVVLCTNGDIVPPAKISTGRLCSEIGMSNENAPAMGQRFQLNMSEAQVDALEVPDWKKTILHALREYGAYVGDTGGKPDKNTWGFQFESGQTYWSFGDPDPLIQFSEDIIAGDPDRQNDDVSHSEVDHRYVYFLDRSVDWAGRLRVLDPPIHGGDTTEPTVSSVSPTDGATAVSRETNVTATFSEAMERNMLTTTTVTLVEDGTTTPISAAVKVSADGKTVTLDPSTDLAAFTTYTATIKGGPSGARDLASNPLATDKVWSFETGSGGCTIQGTEGDDVLAGTEGDDVICGMGGNDIIYDFDGGNDTLMGGEGLDILYFGYTGDDTLSGGEDTDLLIEFDEESGNDTLDGEGGEDYCYADEGDTVNNCEG